MKNNPRITNRDRNNLASAIKRVFSRSELRAMVIEAAVVEHSDPKRKRVKTWCRCAACGKPEARSYCIVDHISPAVPVHTSFAEMGADRFIDSTWCQINNLQCLDPICHAIKTAEEREQRKLLKPKKEKKANESKRTKKSSKKRRAGITASAAKRRGDR